MNKNNYVAIMAGGIGTRFWPMSRTARPKQFLDILNTGKSLLQATYDRFASFIRNENIYILTSEEYVALVKEQLPGVREANVIGEPERKNTAACIALIAMKLKKMNPAANLVVAPSDHLIEDEDDFVCQCLTALAFTRKNNAFVTLGIKPGYANTGYGYIQYEKEAGERLVYPVKRFTEKPCKETAIEFFNDGSYLWNAGIFIWKAADVVSAFEMYMPAMHAAFSGIVNDLNTEREPAAMKQSYSSCPSISIDYAILEKAGNVHVIPASFGWSDLGTWNSAWENFEKDEAQNAVAGSNTLVVDANGCIVHSTDKKLLLIGGVADLIIVNTPDALLVCSKENEQQIKDYLAKVKESKGALYL